MKRLFATTAAFEAGIGIVLLAAPAWLAQRLLGAPLETPAALTVARVGGAGLLSLGIACWFARRDVQGRVARGLVAAMLTYNVAAASVLAVSGFVHGLHGVALWSAVVLHAVMAIWCVACMLA